MKTGQLQKLPTRQLAAAGGLCSGRAHHHAPDVPAIRAGGPLGSNAPNLATYASLLRDLWYWPAPRAFHDPRKAPGRAHAWGLAIFSRTHISRFVTYAACITVQSSG